MARVSIVLSYALAVGKRAGWRGCWGNEMFAGSVAPGRRVMGMDGRSEDNRASK